MNELDELSSRAVEPPSECSISSVFMMMMDGGGGSGPAPTPTGGALLGISVLGVMVLGLSENP
jgi:hypothetical protein